MADWTVAKQVDAVTAATRRVEGNRRVITGTLTQPQAKYVTGGFTVTPASLGFDNKITDLRVDVDKEAKAFPVVERVSDSLWIVKLFDWAGAQLASESEAASGKLFRFRAEGN